MTTTLPIDEDRPFKCSSDDDHGGTGGRIRPVRRYRKDTGEKY